MWVGPINIGTLVVKVRFRGQLPKIGSYHVWVLLLLSYMSSTKRRTWTEWENILLCLILVKSDTEKHSA